MNIENIDKAIKLLEEMKRFLINIEPYQKEFYNEISSFPGGGNMKWEGSNSERQINWKIREYKNALEELIK